MSLQTDFDFAGNKFQCTIKIGTQFIGTAGNAGMIACNLTTAGKSVCSGVFKTFDDPIALNAHDYATSNPQLGWIKDGLIEDCWDLDDVDTTGFFARILAGSWCDWSQGMIVRHSDTVVNDGILSKVCARTEEVIRQIIKESNR